MGYTFSGVNWCRRKRWCWAAASSAGYYAGVGNKAAAGITVAAVASRLFSTGSYAGGCEAAAAV